MTEKLYDPIAQQIRNEARSDLRADIASRKYEVLRQERKLQAILWAFGKLVCGMKKHHIDGNKFKRRGKYFYQCSRCGRLRDGPLPKRRKKMEVPL